MSSYIILLNSLFYKKNYRSQTIGMTTILFTMSLTSNSKPNEPRESMKSVNICPSFMLTADNATIQCLRHSSVPMHITCHSSRDTQVIYICRMQHVPTSCVKLLLSLICLTYPSLMYKFIFFCRLKITLSISTHTKGMYTVCLKFSTRDTDDGICNVHNAWCT